MSLEATSQTSAIEPSTTAQLSEMGQVLLDKQGQLIAELERHDARMAILQQEYSERLRKLKQDRKPVEEALEHVDALLVLEGWSPPDAEDGRTANARESGSISYIDSAHKYLEETGQPTHYKVIADMLEERGVYIPGQERAKTLLAKLNRDKRFIRIKKRGTYALAFWRVKAAKPRSRR